MKKNTRKNSIKVQLFLGFLIPVAFVTMVGSISYKNAEESLTTTFKEATIGSVKMGMKYLDFGFQQVVSEAKQMMLDNDLISYATGAYQNDATKSNSVFKTTKNDIVIKSAANEFINSISIVPKKDGYIMACWPLRSVQSGSPSA